MRMSKGPWETRGILCQTKKKKMRGKINFHYYVIPDWEVCPSRVLRKRGPRWLFVPGIIKCMIVHLHLFTDLLLLLVSDISLLTRRNVIRGSTQRQRGIYFGEASRQNFPHRHLISPSRNRVSSGKFCTNKYFPFQGLQNCVAPSLKVNDA